MQTRAALLILIGVVLSACRPGSVEPTAPPPPPPTAAPASPQTGPTAPAYVTVAAPGNDTEPTSTDTNAAETPTIAVEEPQTPPPVEPGEVGGPPAPPAWYANITVEPAGDNALIARWDPLPDAQWYVITVTVHATQATTTTEVPAGQTEVTLTGLDPTQPSTIGIQACLATDCPLIVDGGLTATP